MKKTCLLIAAAACVVMLHGPFQQADATPITFNFQGTVTGVDLPLMGVFNTTQTISGSYTFESTTADNNPSDPSVGHYPGTLSAAKVTIGGTTWTLGSTTNNSISVFNDLAVGGDVYTLRLFSMSGPQAGGLDPQNFNLDLRDTTASAFSSDALPLGLNLSMFQTATWSMIFSGAYVAGNVTSMAAPVPEPSTLLLLGSGLTGLGYVRRRLRARKA